MNNRADYDQTPSWDDSELPDPPENPEFLELDPELQTIIADRFERGIALREAKDNQARQALINAGINARKRWNDRETRKRSGMSSAGHLHVPLGAALPELGERYRKHRPRTGGNRRVKERS